MLGQGLLLPDGHIRGTPALIERIEALAKANQCFAIDQFAHKLEGGQAAVALRDPAQTERHPACVRFQRETSACSIDFKPSACAG